MKLKNSPSTKLSNKEEAKKVTVEEAEEVETDVMVAEVAVAGEDQEEHPEEDMVEREAGEVMVEREAEEDKTMEINNLHTNLFQHQTVKLRYRNEWILQTIWGWILLINRLINLLF